MNNNLTWSLVVATYNRRSVLMEALYFAATQSRTPKQIIIVDSSPDADATKNILEKQLFTKFCKIEWLFIKSKNKSAAIQRNEGIDHCTGEIVFFIDDDCFMYPKYAEVIMAIYEKDTNKKLMGICGHLTETSPNLENFQETIRLENKHKILIKKILSKFQYTFHHYVLANTSLSRFHQYMGKIPKHKIPHFDLTYNIKPIQLFGAGRATFPLNVIKQNRFNNDLLYYSRGEDLDLTYRLSLLGPMVMVFDAQIFHCHHPTVRPDMYTMTLIGTTNVAYFQQYNNPKSIYRKVTFFRKVLRRIFGGFIHNLIELDFKFPIPRGLIAALPICIKILFIKNIDLRGWYLEFQETIYMKSK
jgi:glycosyltransferase involved in cell wall biosynthesis